MLIFHILLNNNPIIFEPSKGYIGSKLNINASITNVSGNPLTYNVYYVQNGNIRKDRILASGKVNDNNLDVSFNIYSYY